MKIREKGGGERGVEEKRGACVRSERERKRRRVAVGETCCVSVPCGDMMFVMRVCVLWRWRRAMKVPRSTRTNFVPALVARAAQSCESRQQE